MLHKVFAASLAAFLTSASAGVVRVPVRKTVSSNYVAKGMLEKGGASEPLYNFNNQGFYGQIKVGGQPFQMNFDTGIGNVWVPDKACDSHNCFSHPRYDESKSPNSHEDGRAYFQGSPWLSVNGTFGKDTLTIGGLDIKGQLFAKVSSTVSASNLYGAAKFDGLFGLGFRSASQHNIPTPFDLMLEQKLIDEPVFAFYFSSDDSENGELVLGGVDHSHFTGELVDVPLVPPQGPLSKSSWVVMLDAVSFGGSTVGSSMPALVDSAAPNFVGPQEAVAAMAQKVGAKMVEGNYVVDCSTKASMPDLEIKLGGHNFTLTADDYVLKGTGRVCLFGFSGIDKPLWILSTAFMRKYYSVFDQGNRQVRFAPAAKGVKVVSEPTDLVI